MLIVLKTINEVMYVICNKEGKLRQSQLLTVIYFICFVPNIKGYSAVRNGLPSLTLCS
jgi:hypothetical protein